MVITPPCPDVVYDADPAGISQNVQAALARELSLGGHARARRPNRTVPSFYAANDTPRVLAGSLPRFLASARVCRVHGALPGVVHERTAVRP